MKKILAVMMSLGCISCFATLQYETSLAGPECRMKLEKCELTLKVIHGGSMWVTGAVFDYALDLGSRMDMSAGSYGVIINGETRIAGTGESKEVEMPLQGGSGSATVKAYYVGELKAGDEVSFWLTSSDGKIGSSDGSLGGKGEALARSVDPRPDQAGNRIFTLTFRNDAMQDEKISFTFIGSERPTEVQPVGQPLPGMIIALLIGAGTVGAGIIGRSKFSARKQRQS